MNQRIQGFDGLRTLAVTMVFVAHFHPLPGDLGGFGVWIFFALSGFLITGILREQRVLIESQRTTVTRAAKGFYYRRTLRIFPIYYLVILIDVVFNLSQALPISDGLPYWLVYMGNVWAAHRPVGWPAGWGGHLWTLAVEEQFYILLAPLLLWSPTSSHRVILIGLIVIGLVWTFVAPHFGLTRHQLYLSSWHNFALLSAGGLGRVLLEQRPASFLRWRGTLWICLGCVGLDPVAEFAGWEGTTIVGLVAQVATMSALLCCVLWVYVNQESRLVRALSARIIAHIGKISYGLYLIHPAVISWWHNLYDHSHNSSPLANAVSSSLSICCCYALTVLVAHLLWTYFESPILKYRDHFSSGARHSVNRPFDRRHPLE